MHSIGASLGSAFVAARAVASPTFDDWNPVAGEVVPQPELAAVHDRLYGLYRDLCSSTLNVSHALAEIQSTRNHR